MCSSKQSTPKFGSGAPRTDDLRPSDVRIGHRDGGWILGVGVNDMHRSRMRRALTRADLRADSGSVVPALITPIESGANPST